MTSKLAIDFGTSNTVLAYWDNISQDTQTLHLSGLSRLVPQGATEVSVIPSYIHYTDNNEILVGNEVFAQRKETAQQTFREIKTQIRLANPVAIKIGRRTTNYQQMGRDFLNRLLEKANSELIAKADEVAITVPVESLELYNKWLIETIDPDDRARFRLLDEPVAAALGYGIKFTAGDCFLVFDFGGGTLDVAIVYFEEPIGERYKNVCRVVGKSGVALGGADIDSWIADEILRKNNRDVRTDEFRTAFSALLLRESELIKQKLSSKESSHGLIMNPLSGKSLNAEISRAELESLLEQKQLFKRIGDAIKAALTQAEERGFHRDDIKRVLMVGGCSLIPSVQRKLKEMFGEHRILLDRPLEAVARGAQMLLIGTNLIDYLQHDYAIKSRSPGDGAYNYELIVRRGTAYPSAGAILTRKIKGTRDGQQAMGLEIFEVVSNNLMAEVQLNFGQGSGTNNPIVAENTAQYVWINQANPTFLQAEPPAERGESRFEIEFYLDENRRLLITTTDLRSGKKLHKMYPVVKLR